GEFGRACKWAGGEFVDGDGGAFAAAGDARSLDVELLRERLVRALDRIVEEDFPLLIGRFFVGRAPLANSQKPNGIDGRDDGLRWLAWFANGHRFDQRPLA